MENGLGKIHVAVDVLRDRQVPLRDRLERASQLIWSASYYRDEWPDTDRRWVEDLFATLLRQGTIKCSVQEMSDAEVDDLVAELLEWSEKFEAKHDAVPRTSIESSGGSTYSSDCVGSVHVQIET